jgi:trehalose-phosphatase
MTDRRSSVIPVQGIPDFWERLGRASRKFLALDYDGTLAPFREHRMEAFPLEGMTDCLSRIAGARDTTLIIISGRPVEEILLLLGDLGVMIVGSQGWETRAADGSHRQTLPSLRQRRMLRAAMKDVARLGFEDRTETKIAGLAVHTRGLPKNRAEAIEEELVHLWEFRAAENAVECRRFDGGVELRATGVDKGSALLRLLKGRSEDTFSVYVGDDETDEDAFGVIRGIGYGIKVGHPEAPTRARGGLPDCEAVLEFLKEWNRVSDSG